MPKQVTAESPAAKLKAAIAARTVTAYAYRTDVPGDEVAEFTFVLEDEGDDHLALLLTIQWGNGPRQSRDYGIGCDDVRDLAELLSTVTEGE